MGRTASELLLRDFHEGGKDEEEKRAFTIKGIKLFEKNQKHGLWRRKQRNGAVRLPIQAISPPAVTFGYEIYEGNLDQLTDVDVPNSNIDPESLKLKHRIGHGIFGDVWLATYHQSGKDHEVAVKMLHPIKEDHVPEFLYKFEEVWRNLKQLRGVCWLLGISIISGQICIVYKWYEGSVDDRIAGMDGRKLPLSRVLRYGAELANGIQKLHQVGLLVLNLKPSNFLLDENDHIVLGDFGIPYLLLGILWSDPCSAMRCGTHNYMAPEQWEPGVRGPISYETDSWGFACSLIEMLTGVPPWFGRSTEEMHRAVVIRREKPRVPTGLPPAVEQILEACFEYDLRNRPLMPDILHALERERKAVYCGRSWSKQGRNLYANNGYATWFLLKDHIKVGDSVRSRKDTNTPQNSPIITQGVVVGQRGLDMCNERDKIVIVQCPNMRIQFELKVSSLQKVTSGFAPGDWVQLVDNKTNEKQRLVIGIVHHIRRDGIALVGFLGMETLWRGCLSELELVEPFFVGGFVRLKTSVGNPKFEWPYKRSGKISRILPNGCLEVRFPGRFAIGDGSGCFLANPEEVERVSFETCRGILGKYEFVEDLHWAVKPITIGLGLLAVTFVGGKALLGISKWRRNET